MLTKNSQGDFDASWQAPFPAGFIWIYAGSAVPAGWLACNGAAVSRSTYAALFAAIGTTWGTGDGSTTFNLPDLRSRTLVGSSGTAPSGLTARGLATNGGEENHVLATGEMPSHAHGVSDPGHTHTFTNVITQALYATQGISSSWSTMATPYNPVTSSTATGIGIQATGGGGGHNNMPPWASVSFMIRT